MSSRMLDDTRAGAVTQFPEFRQYFANVDDER
jgi:hypothetical protein